MRRTASFATSIVVGALSVLALTAPPAGAAPTSFGITGAPSSITACTGADFVASGGPSSNPFAYAVPADGFLTAWKVQGGSHAANAQFEVWHAVSVSISTAT